VRRTNPRFHPYDPIAYRVEVTIPLGNETDGSL